MHKMTRLNMEIRNELKQKLLYFYPNTFKLFENIINDLGEMDWYIQMNSCALQDLDQTNFIQGNGLRMKTINMNLDLNLDVQILIQELFDDLGAGLHCFVVGYFKQSQSLLRNSIESAIQLWKLKAESKSGDKIFDNWTIRKRGIEKVNDACDKIEQLEEEYKGIKNKIRTTNKLYSRLCMSTHSHKDRMNVLNSPRSESTFKGQVFEYLEYFYTRNLFIYTLCLHLDLLIILFTNQANTDLKKPILKVLNKQKNNLLDRHEKDIKNFEKGFLIFKESLKINESKKVEMYSVDLDGNFKELTKHKTMLTEKEQKEFKNKMYERYMVD